MIPAPSPRRPWAPWRGRPTTRGGTPRERPGTVPPRERPGTVPPRERPGTVPPRERPGTVPPRERPGFDQDRIAREAQGRFNKSLDELEETFLPKLRDEKIKVVVAGAVERVRGELNTLVIQGVNASPSQVLFVVLISKESEDEIQASIAEASDDDKKVLQGIEKQLKKANVPFWAALASLGKVKEWSASLEISAGLFAVKGSGGISVTFGK
jgi:hypothetical protein